MEGDVVKRQSDPGRGGGGLLGIGVYPIATAFFVFRDAPLAVCGQAHLGETGVDEQAGIVLKFPAGRLALLSCGWRTAAPFSALVCGTEGQIAVHPPQQATRLELRRPGREPEVLETGFPGNGFNHEAEEVARCLARGAIESDAMPLDESLAVMETMDELRRQWGLTYPMDQPQRKPFRT
jgi:predicted dehydrogenase